MIARKVGRPVKLKLSVSYEWFICSINPWQCLLQRMLSFFACWQRTIDESAYFEEGHTDCHLALVQRLSWRRHREEVNGRKLALCTSMPQSL